MLFYKCQWDKRHVKSCPDSTYAITTHNSHAKLDHEGKLSDNSKTCDQDVILKNLVCCSAIAKGIKIRYIASVVTNMQLKYSIPVLYIPVYVIVHSNTSENYLKMG